MRRKGCGPSAVLGEKNRAWHPLLVGFADLTCMERSLLRSPGKTMRLDRLTTKSQEALRSAVDAASRRGHPELIPEHLLVAILAQEEGVGRALVERAGAQ